MTNMEPDGLLSFEPTTLIGNEVIICAGDSFTKWPIYAECGIKTWPELISEHFQRKVIVVGQPGAGNKLIQQKVTEQLISENKIHMVLVMWTTMARTMWKRDTNLYENIRPISTYSYNQLERIDMDSFKLVFSKLIDNEHMHHLVDESMNAFYNLQEQLKSKKIPYKFFWYRDTPIKGGVEIFVKHNLYSQIENFVGWPLYEEIGGCRLVTDEMCFGGDERLRAHPNQLGHNTYFNEILYHLN